MVGKMRQEARVVLDVPRRQPLVGSIPLVALQQLAHDVQRRLHIAIDRGVVGDEQRFGIVDGDDGRRLCERVAADEKAKGSEYVSFHWSELPAWCGS